MDRLGGKVAVITGASSGIGRAIATMFAVEGAKVVCADVQEEPKDGIDEAPTDVMIRAEGGEAAFVICDVTKSAEVQELIRAAVDHYGKLDIIVNNAGVSRHGKLLHEFTEEDLDACYSVNTKGTFFGMQEAIKQFLKQGTGGSIVNIISTAGISGYPRQSVYNASKGAAALLTQCAAIEYGRDNIRVNGICPTYVLTPKWRTAKEKWGYDFETFHRRIADALPLHRWGDPTDIAQLAVFLASAESSFITGDLIRVDGGDTLSRFSV